jgi:ataxin-3
MNRQPDVWIFHELQESALCGQHAINNLLQESLFSAVDLAEIAHELDAQERRCILEGGNLSPDALRLLSESSGNVDESGNFSIQVLRAALQRSHGVELISWSGAEGKQQTDPTAENGFIVNRSAHWFAIRKINNRWWNLNSTLEKPEVVSPFYLSAFLTQLRSDGYTVFIARGTLPKCGEKPFAVPNRPGSNWHRERDLLGPDAPPQEHTWGQGNRLGGEKPKPQAASAISHVPSSQEEEERMIALAIAESLKPSGSHSNTGKA